VSLRFSEEGPAFPAQLVDALLAGEVVFLCGAGISAPQLPGFGELVEKCFTQLRMSRTASEQKSFDDGRFEEVLGSLSRRIVDPDRMVRIVAEILSPPVQPDLTHHQIILRLSRDVDNQPVIVTTNFDTLLEKALLGVESGQQVRTHSFAGQDLPSPGKAGFGGVIHLHGRITDEQIGLDETQLVITSADYGDAYMRSGWASRFLFDLCRCKTIVLIGYSAGDAPVRYFLNVLEADRQRFPDLRPVYAFDPVAAREEPDMQWEALAVEPIAYEPVINAATGLKDKHKALWCDLGKLANLVERPRDTRCKLAKTILINPFSSANVTDLDLISWLFSGTSDLWPVAIEVIEDPAWFDFFAERKLWTQLDAAWIVAAWLAKDLQSVDRYRLAISWAERLGQPFVDSISQRLRQIKELSDLWLRAWRLFAISRPRQANSDDGIQSYAIQQTLSGHVVLYADLQRALELLTPTLSLSSYRNELHGFSGSTPPARLADITQLRVTIQSRMGAAELVDALVKLPQSVEIMKIATEKLQSVIGMSLDIEAIGEDFDINDFDVPSVEPHPQNEYHDGVTFLIQLLARILPKAAQADRNATRLLAESWHCMPGILGVRLWLHALRDASLFSPDESIDGLEALPLSIFWHVRREIALVLRERTADANPQLVSRIEQRILTEGETYFARYTIEKGQVDWRSHALDTEVWLRLNMLEKAGILSIGGATELAEIKSRREYLNRAVVDRDFFGSYSTGVQMIHGNAQPIMEAAVEDRLEVAREITHSPNVENRLGWSTYCNTDPLGAFDALSNEPLDATNAPLWSDLINTLSFPLTKKDAIRDALFIKVFATLKPAKESFLHLIISQLVGLYCSGQRQEAKTIADWWPRLFSIAVSYDTVPLDGDRKFFDDAINAPGGRLTRDLLIEIDQCRKTGGMIGQSLLDNIIGAASISGRQGAYARAVLISEAGFVLPISPLNVAESLCVSLEGDTTEAVALRSVLVSYARTSLAASGAFGKHILRGLTELDAQHQAVTPVAAEKIIAPALSIIRKEPEAAQWGITLEDTAQILRDGSPPLRRGAIQVLVQWITTFNEGPAEAWATSIGPLLEEVWPRDRILRDKRLTRLFASLAIQSAEAFPSAFSQLRPYLTRLEGNDVFYEIGQSTLPEQFPRETLSLLWQLFGPGYTGSLYGAPDILERMITSEQSIECDRRLQWLDLRATRFR
jgi:hypothetical protein